MTPAQVFAEFCRARYLSAETVRGRSREPSIVRIRRELAGVMTAAGCSSVEIGKVLGRDHTTVLHMLGRTQRGKVKRVRDGGET